MLYYLNLLLEVLIRIWLVCHWKGLAPSSGGMATQGWRKKARRRVGGLVAGRPVKDSSSAHRGRHPITRAKEKLFQATILSIQSWGENQDRQQLSSINAARKYASVSQLFQWQTFSTFVKAVCQTKLDKQEQQQRSITAGTRLSSCCWRWAGFGFVRTWVGFGRALITQHLYQPPLFGTNPPQLSLQLLQRHYIIVIATIAFTIRQSFPKSHQYVDDDLPKKFKPFFLHISHSQICKFIQRQALPIPKPAGFRWMLIIFFQSTFCAISSSNSWIVLRKDFHSWLCFSSWCIVY